MELAQLTSPDGAWSKVWLAAHWDKKLKKQDYVDADLPELLESFLAKKVVFNLRATGHLLLGACKIYGRKCLLFDEDAIELRTRLMMAFSADKPQENEDQAAPMVGDLDIIQSEVDDYRPGKEPAAGTLLGGKRHIARLEDITLRDPVKLARRRSEEDVFGAMRGAELEKAMKDLRKHCALPSPEAPAGFEDMFDGGFDTQPLVGVDADLGQDVLEAGARALNEAIAELDAGTPMPLDMDHMSMDEDPMPLQIASPSAPAEDAVASHDEMEGGSQLGVRSMSDGMAENAEPAPLSEDGASTGFGSLASSRRRRRAMFILDDSTEISKEVYQNYVNDRSAITRKEWTDYAVWLPHYSPNLPSFSTTFTDLCPALVDGLLWGADVAEKRRKLTQDAEMSGRSEAFNQAAQMGAALPPLSPGSPGSPGAPGTGATSPVAQVNTNPLSPWQGQEIPKDLAGLRSPEALPGEKAPLIADAVTLLRNAPTSMGAVVTGGMDTEDQGDNAAVRVGYSGRTEKMHRFLAKEFSGSESGALSYGNLCKTQATGRRELIAGCFFELLVLKTNGVIGLEQDAPLSDIKISKAPLFSKD